MTRSRCLCLAAALALVAPLLSAAEAKAEPRPQEIAEGMELQAKSNVTLDRAEIAKGSRVSVTKVSKTGTRVDTLNVALADGHVVRVTMALVKNYFSVVQD